MNAQVRWEGIETIEAGLDAYQQAINDTVLKIAQYVAPQVETYAKENARWEDQTGNARQTLQADALAFAQDAVILYIAHGMDYGIFLEVRWAGKFSILWEALSAHFELITRMLREAFG